MCKFIHKKVTNFMIYCGKNHDEKNGLFLMCIKQKKAMEDL